LKFFKAYSAFYIYNDGDSYDAKLDLKEFLRKRLPEYFDKYEKIYDEYGMQFYSHIRSVFIEFKYDFYKEYKDCVKNVMSEFDIQSDLTYDTFSRELRDNLDIIELYDKIDKNLIE
jgi:hypothetical protein